MSSNLIANRYAKALLALTQGQPELADQASRFFNLCKSIFDLEEGKKVLCSPVMPAELKKSLIHLAAEKAQVSPVIRTFGDTIVDAGRVKLLLEIAQAYEKMLQEKNGIAQALVTTAEPLSGGMEQDLKSALEGVFKKKVSLKNEVDPAVFGGVVVKVGNYTIDLSLKSRLDQVAEHAQR